MTKKPYMGRDHLLLKIIGGATKAGVEPDRKKEANKTESRGKKMNRASQGQNQAQQNTMQLQELKALKEQLAKAKASTLEAINVVVAEYVKVIAEQQETIRDMEGELQELRAQVNLTAMFDPNTEENRELAFEWAIAKQKTIETLQDEVKILKALLKPVED